MAGHTLEEAKAAQCAATGKPPCPIQNAHSANIATTATSTVTDQMPTTTPTRSTLTIPAPMPVTPTAPSMTTLLEA